MKNTKPSFLTAIYFFLSISLMSCDNDDNKELISDKEVNENLAELKYTTGID